MDTRYSISEVADKLNVTKQCIYNKLKVLNKQLAGELFFKNRVRYLTEKGLSIIEKDLNSTDSKNSTDSIDSTESIESVESVESVELKKQIHLLNNYIDDIKLANNSQIEILKEQLKIKDNQLESKDKLIENMQILLKQSQTTLEKYTVKYIETSKKTIFKKFFEKFK